MAAAPRRLVLFDVDGTLTAARKRATPEMLEFLARLRTHTRIAIVGGSDLAKQREQLGEDVLTRFDWTFSENGLVALKGAEEIGRTSMVAHLGEARMKEFINFTLMLIASVDIPVKRGTFIEFRAGMLNVSPIGRNCSQAERDAFEAYDKVHGVRARMVRTLQAQFSGVDGLRELQYSIGGQISFDVFPKGWDKTYCLRYLDGVADEIHFFGDKTFPGGNDYEIFVHPGVKGHTTTGPEDTMRQCRELFMPDA